MNSPSTHHLKYVYCINHIEKRGTGVFLLKERSRLIKIKKNKTKHTLSTRLSGNPERDEEMKIEHQQVTKRRKENPTT